jgi:hypothetical protein
MTIKKLARMPYAQAHVEIDKDGNIYLFSYRTLVIELTADGWLTCTGTYSTTTRKHIGAFMKEYVQLPNGERGYYQIAKHAYEGNYRWNMETGEIEELGE